MDEDITKLFLFTQTRISKGKERIKELSVFDGKLSSIQFDDILRFRSEERKFAESMRDSLLLFAATSKEYPILSGRLEGLLVPYLNLLQTFPDEFPG